MNNTPVMRAKLQVQTVSSNDSGENLVLTAIGPNGTYPEDGSDENNTFARFTPAANLTIFIANPELFGKFKQRDTFYVDFTRVE